MGLFSRNFDRPGPGVPKDAPQKKGFARFFEILMRDFSTIWRSSLLLTLCCIPLGLVVSFGWVYRQYLGMLAIAAVLYMLAALLVGPALCAGHTVMFKAVRDIPGYFWHDYKKAWKSCWRQAAPISSLFCALAAMECISLGMFFTVEEKPSAFFLGFIVLGMLLVVGIWLMVLAQIVYLDMGLFPMVKNALLLFFGKAKRVLPATLIILAALFLAAAVFSPLLDQLLILLGVPGMIMLIADMWVWPVMDEVFNISQLQAEKQKQEEETR